MDSDNRRPLIYAIIASLGGFIFGFDASVISGVVGFVTTEFELDVWQQGWVVGAPTLTAVLGALSVVPMGDFLGRKRMLIVVAALYVLSAIASAFAPNVLVLILARGIGGFAFASLMLTPIYIAEIAPPKVRGTLVSVNQMNIVVGFSAAYFANYFLLQLSDSDASWVQTLGMDVHTWRWMLGLEIVPAVIWTLCLVSIPESPRWLVVKGRLAAARKSLLRLVAEQEVEQRIEEVQEHLESAKGVNKDQRQGIFAIVKKLRFAFMLGLIVAIAQQITGINAVFFYAPSIFEQSGVGTDAAFAQAILVGLINVVVTVIAMVTIDRMGRKPLLIIGLAGVLISHSLVAYGFSKATYELTDENVASLSEAVEQAKLAPLVGQTFEDDVSYKQALIKQLGEAEAQAHESELIQAAISMNPIIVLIGILGFVASFALSLGPVMWVMLSEIFPNHIRAMCMAAVGCINSGVSFGVQFIFPWELAHLGTAMTFMIYGMFALIGLVLVIVLFPETKGKSLEELEEILLRD